MTGRTIFLTGATDGIGLALATLWAQRGERLILHGRRAPEELPAELLDRGSYCQADLADADAAAKAVAHLDERGVDALDLLVHNAGVGYYGEVGAQPSRNIAGLLRVNLEAPLALTHALLPRLERAGGRLVLISSIAAAVPCPDYAVYAASKAALEGFARALRIELKGRVGVQVVRPGPTRTGMHSKIGAPPEKVPAERFPAAPSVAAGIARAIDRGHRRATIGLGNRALGAAGAHLAAPLDALMRRKRTR
ncbi:MAG: SDR family NAD(P)-dependent oxidoreductase [Planctomycetota bacterium]